VCERGLCESCVSERVIVLTGLCIDLYTVEAEEHTHTHTHTRAGGRTRAVGKLFVVPAAGALASAGFAQALEPI
jgi:hypothetical protein